MSQENISKIGFSFDPGIIGVLGDRKYSTYSEALNEIIRNSIGYKAQKIEIEISTDKIVVRDNGLGMDLDDLTNQYFRIGRATKDATTGSLFGIGKFANQSLAHKTEIITKKQGNIKKIQIFIDWDIAEKSEEIDSLHPNAYKPEFKEIICSSEEHGTTITLTNLKYKPDIIELKRYLGKKLFPRLITNQVEILINNQKCTAMEPQGQSFAFDSTENFTLETKEVPPIPEASFGKVWGKFYLTEPDDNNALNVYDSFGHRVDIYSEKDWLKLSSKFTSGIAFKKRFVGIIHTKTEETRNQSSSSEKCLLLKSDRSAFFEDTFSYTEMVKYIHDIVKIIHEKWLQEYRDISSKMNEMIKKELPTVSKVLETILSETGWVWKRNENGTTKTVVKKHQEKGGYSDNVNTSQHKMLQCPLCRTIEYIPLAEYKFYIGRSEEEKIKMSEKWPCKGCGYYLNPEKDLYKRKSPEKKPGFITTKVKLGSGKSIEIQPTRLGKTSDMASYDPDNEFLELNTEHAFYVKAAEVGSVALRHHMILASLYAIAQARKREEKTEFEVEFNNLCSLVYRMVEKGQTIEFQK